MDDLISRQAVNNLVDELARAISDERCCIPRGRSTATIMQDIVELPSVTAERKGKWIFVHPLQEDDGGDYMCSECKCGHPYISPNWKYCPNCGAKMEVE